MREIIELQRKLTLDHINKRRINAPVEWLRPDSEYPESKDTVQDISKLVVDLRDWDNPANDSNLGVRLVDGYIEIRIVAPDHLWTSCFFEACQHLRIDARAAFGLEGRPISSIIVKTEDPAALERWVNFWPRGGRDKAGQWVATSFVASSTPSAKSAKPVWRQSKPLPGSRLDGRAVVWRPLGKPWANELYQGLEDFGAQELAAASMERIVRAHGYATLLYWVRAYLEGLAWDQSLSRILGGWVARLADEGRKVNAKGKGADVMSWASVDSRETAADLVAFLRATAGAGRDFEDAWSRAALELERHPEARVPGWDALGNVLSLNARISLRAAFAGGADVERLERFADRYVFDLSSNGYFDREALFNGFNFAFGHEELVRRHENEPIFSEKGKRYNPFRQFAASKFRRDVAAPEFFPDYDPGAILRLLRTREVLTVEETRPDEFSVFNSWRGFPIKPAQEIDKTAMATALSALDRLLAVICNDNTAQILWIKKWLAWIVQHPGLKQQSAIVLIGGQGIGKSVFGANLMHALFGSLASSANAASFNQGRFFVTPYIDTLVVFVDEAKLENTGAINQLKKLIRSEWVMDELKYQHARMHHTLARSIIAANEVNIGFTPEDTADRTLFMVQGPTSNNRRMTEHGFNDWTLTLKPFFEELIGLLEHQVIRQHLMRYCLDLECTRAELESLEYSSRSDAEIMRSTASKAKLVARAIIADARVLDKFDITAWFTKHQLQAAIVRVNGRRSQIEADSVLLEFEKARLIEPQPGGHYRFKWGYGLLVQKISEAHDNWALRPEWPIDREDDYQDNKIGSPWRQPPWRGRGDRARYGEPYDPDYLPPE